MGLLKGRKKKKNFSEASVNITSLLDVLTVLLFFLIKSFSMDSSTLAPPKGIRLPASHVQVPAREAVRVALNREGILADDKPLVSLKNGQFQEADLLQDKRTIKPLKEYLDKQIEKRKNFFKGVAENGDLPPNEILIQADKDLPFGLLKYVLHTAAFSGYSDYQFVVVEEK